MSFVHRYLLGLEGLGREELTFLLDTASSFNEPSEDRKARGCRSAVRSRRR